MGGDAEFAEKEAERYLEPLDADAEDSSKDDA